MTWCFARCNVSQGPKGKTRPWFTLVTVTTITMIMDMTMTMNTATPTAGVMKT